MAAVNNTELHICKLLREQSVKVFITRKKGFIAVCSDRWYLDLF